MGTFECSGQMQVRLQREVHIDLYCCGIPQQSAIGFSLHVACGMPLAITHVVYRHLNFSWAQWSEFWVHRPHFSQRFKVPL